MLRELVKILSYMDWMRPLLTVYQNRKNGPSHTFLISDDCGWSPKQVEHYLRDRGLKTWGLDVFRNSIMLSTTRQQASLMQQLLAAQGITVDNPVELRSEGHSHVKSQPQPQRHKRPRASLAGQNPIDSFNDSLDKLFGRFLGE